MVVAGSQGLVRNVTATLGELAQNALARAWSAIARGKVMAHIWQLDPPDAKSEAEELADGVQQRLGMAPNTMRVTAASPAVLGGYLSLSVALAQGTLDARFRRQVALAVAQASGCEYSLACHAAVARRMGMTEAEIDASRRSRSFDAKKDAGLKFVRTLVGSRGQIADQGIRRLKAAGYGDTEIVELVANVALSVFVNYFNSVLEEVY